MLVLGMVILVMILRFFRRWLSCFLRLGDDPWFSSSNHYSDGLMHFWIHSRQDSLAKQWPPFFAVAMTGLLSGRHYDDRGQEKCSFPTPEDPAMSVWFGTLVNQFRMIWLLPKRVLLKRWTMPRTMIVEIQWNMTWVQYFHKWLGTQPRTKHDHQTLSFLLGTPWYQGYPYDTHI